MPSDVPLGAGYCGDALLSRFPGQYRESEQQAAGSSFFSSFPGNHGPQYTDPDSGRQMVMKEIPGVGQVVVPADHNMAAVVPVDHHMAAVYPSDHTMVGLDDGDEPGSDLGRLMWHKKLVLALDQSANMPDSGKQLVLAFSQVAQEAVKRALEKSSRGRFSTPDDALQFVRKSIVSSASAFKPAVQQLALRIADQTATAAEPALKKAWTSKKPAQKRGGKGHPRKPGPAPASGTADWPGSMMGVGGLKESIANAAAGGSLDELARSISRLLDSITDAYNQVTLLKEQEAKAMALSASGVASAVGSLFGGSKSGPSSDELNVQYLSAMKAVKEGYKALTGFDYLTQVLANVFAPNAAALAPVYSGIAGLLGQIRNWNDTWQRQIGDANPDMVSLWDAIQNRHNALYAQATGGAKLDFDNPAYVSTAGDAVKELTGVDPAQAGVSGMGDFGITACVATIAICIAAVVVAVAIVKLAGQFNVVANNIAEQRKQYEAQMASRHDEYVARRQAEGVDAQTAEQEWLQLKQQYDAQEAQKEADYGKNAPSALDMGKVLTYGGLAVGAAIAIPHIMKAVGL